MESGLRKITPQRLALSLIQSLGEGRVETLADLQREFNRMHGLNVAQAVDGASIEGQQPLLRLKAGTSRSTSNCPGSPSPSSCGVFVPG